VSPIPIALQLYSVRHDCERDLPGTLSAVAAMGYEGVEFAGYYGRSAEELRDLLDRSGLRCVGTHTALDTLLPPNLSETAAFNRTLGNRNLVVPSLPAERRGTLQAWLDTARLFNELAEAAAQEGMRVGYHNHMEEFQPVDGKLPMDVWLQHTHPNVIMQIDLGNALRGGGDPVRYLRDYPERAVTVHLKEYAADNDRALIGEGDVDWAEVFRICEASGATEWYIVEQESYAYPPLECVDRCLQNLRKMM